MLPELAMTPAYAMAEALLASEVNSLNNVHQLVTPEYTPVLYGKLLLVQALYKALDKANIVVDCWSGFIKHLLTM